MSCITLPRGQRHWIGSRVKSNQRWSRSSPASTCPAWTGCNCLARSSGGSPDLPVMMVTAYGDDKRRRQAAEYGAAEFLTKPADFEYLKAQLRQLPSALD